MASAFAHAAAALGLGAVLRPSTARQNRLMVYGAAVAVLPDLDSIGYSHGIPYDSLLGHRGLTHSIIFAMAMALAVVSIDQQVARPFRLRAWTFLFVAGISHGVLDAMTTGGLGVAFLAPFDNSRFFFPWRPIPVSPLNMRRFFSSQGLKILEGEFLWVGIPSLALVLVGSVVRRLRMRSKPST